MFIRFETANVNLESLNRLQASFGQRLQRGVPLDRFTSARVGGTAEILLEVESADELAQAATLLWSEGVAWKILGGGSNVLVSDSGVRGVVVVNRARKVRFDEDSDHGCTVGVKSEILDCPCHGSRYDVEGNAIRGPAGKPLQYLRVELTADGNLIVYKS